MEQQPIEKKKHGGSRPGSGRKKNSTEQITVKGLMTSLAQRSGGKQYQDLLVEDFLAARAASDKNLVMKYHQLILNKVMSTLATVEITDSQANIEAKQQAFADALAKLVEISKE